MPRWHIAAMVLAMLVIVLIVLAALVGGNTDALTEVIERFSLPNSFEILRNTNPLISQALSSDDSSNIRGAELHSPGANFSGAYVLGVEDLSSFGSIIHIFVPGGVEGTYHAVVSGADTMQFECVILHHYTDRLHCVGPALQEASQINLKIFKVNESSGSQILVFDVNYTTGEIGSNIASTAEPTPTLILSKTPTRTLDQTPTHASEGSDEGDNKVPPPTSTSIPPTNENPEPSATSVAPTNTNQPPLATETPRVINPPSCNDKSGHPRYCTPSPEP